MPFILALAEKGYNAACLENPHLLRDLLRGLNIYQGHITNEAVALALQKPYVPPVVALQEKY